MSRQAQGDNVMTPDLPPSDGGSRRGRLFNHPVRRLGLVTGVTVVTGALLLSSCSSASTSTASSTNSASGSSAAPAAGSSAAAQGSSAAPAATSPVDTLIIANPVK